MIVLQGGESRKRYLRGKPAAIQEGVNLAGERGGGLVAAAVGTCFENIQMGHGHNGGFVGGRCRERVVIEGSGAPVPAVAIVSDARRDRITLGGLTLTQGMVGLRVSNAAAVADRLTIAARGYFAGYVATGMRSRKLFSKKPRCPIIPRVLRRVFSTASGWASPLR